MRIETMGPIPADGGSFFVVSGAPAGAAVEWTLAGHGALTALSTWTDENGLAAARYYAPGGTPAAEGDSVTVTARVYGA